VGVRRVVLLSALGVELRQEQGLITGFGQRNVLDRRRWTRRDELRIAIVTWIERTYHRRRRQAALGRLTPIEYEMINTPQANLAA
jgi:transposase InsO family protein